MKRSSVAWLALVVFLFACGDAPREESPPEEPSASEVPEAVEVVVAVDLPDTLRSLVEGWAEGYRARVVWRDADDVGGATLAEVDAVGVIERAARGELRTWSEDAAADFWLADVARVDGVCVGVPWRGDLVALASDRSLGWPDLARLGDGLVLDPDVQLDAFLALAAGTGAAIEPGTPHDLDVTSEASVEALSFLRRLATRARTEGDARARILSSASRDTTPDRVVRALPARKDEAPGRTAARVRILVVPVDAPHGDLGVDLARWLSAPDRARLLHRDPVHGLSMHRGVQDPAVGPWLELRSVACLRPTTGPAPRAWIDELEAAVTAAVERRRAPETALREAVAARGR